MLTNRLIDWRQCLSLYKYKDKVLVYPPIGLATWSFLGWLLGPSLSDAWISSPFCGDCLESTSFLVTAWNLPPYFGIVGVSCRNCFNTRGLLGIRLLTMRRRLVWLLLGVSLLPVPTLSTAEEACDKTLDLQVATLYWESKRAKQLCLLTMFLGDLQG